MEPFRNEIGSRDFNDQATDDNDFDITFVLSNKNYGRFLMGFIQLHGQLFEILLGFFFLLKEQVVSHNLDVSYEKPLV